MSDILQRLRLLVPSDSSGAAIEAADTIAALTARVEELEAIGNQLEAEALDYATQNKELREAGQEVLHLSDRKHAAWDRLRAAITKGESHD